MPSNGSWYQPVSMAQIAELARTLPSTRPVVIYDDEGGAVCRTAFSSLVALGHPAHPLEGGFTAWRQAGLVTIRLRAELNAAGGSRWTTRARPKIDRLACPWLVRRFIDPDAAFFYTPRIWYEATR